MKIQTQAVSGVIPAANHFNCSGYFSPGKVQPSPQLEFVRENLGNTSTPLALPGFVIKHGPVRVIDAWCPRVLARRPPGKGVVTGGGAGPSCCRLIAKNVQGLV